MGKWDLITLYAAYLTDAKKTLRIREDQVLASDACFGLYKDSRIRPDFPSKIFGFRSYKHCRHSTVSHLQMSRSPTCQPSGL